MCVEARRDTGSAQYVEAMQGKARRDTGSVQCVWRLYKGRLEGTQAVCRMWRLCNRGQPLFLTCLYDDDL